MLLQIHDYVLQFFLMRRNDMHGRQIGERGRESRDDWRRWCDLGFILARAEPKPEHDPKNEVAPHLRLKPRLPAEKAAPP